MKRILYLFIFSICSVVVTGQSFSLIIDPIQGDETNFHNNLAINVEISNDRLIISGQHSCFPIDGGDNNFICGSLSSFDFEGNLLDAVLVDSFFNTAQDGLLTIEDRIFTANFKINDPSESRMTYIQEFDSNLKVVKQTAIPSRPNSTSNNSGLKFIDNHFYIHGDRVVDEGRRSKGFIQKLDTDLNLLWDRQFEHEESVNGCDNLQATVNDELVFIHKYASVSSGPGISGIQVVKLDSNGIKIDSLQIEGERGEALALVSGASGGIYAYTIAHPFDESIFEQSYGRINKYSNDLDTLLWSLKLPFNNYFNGRQYNVFDLVEARNGEILACGSVFDLGTDGLANGENHVFNAWASRISPEGEILWLHLYKVVNNKFFPLKEFGEFHTSVLSTISELEDGRIVIAGTAALNSRQVPEVIGTSEPHSEFLILALDGTTGCIEGEECDEVIILDGKYRPRDNYLSILNSGNVWYVEQESEYGELSNFQISYSKVSSPFENNPFYDRLYNSNTAEEFVNGTFREIGGQIYQKLEGNLNEELIFDIHLQTGEEISLVRQGNPIEFEAISTDTIVLLDDIPRKRIFLQCTSTSEPQESIIWIEGIGELDNSKLCNFEGQKNEIFCVQDSLGNLIYSLIDNGCVQELNTCAPISFKIGDKWIYEKYINFSTVTFQNIEIVDEMEWMGEQALVVRPALINDEDYVVQKDDKIYFWDYFLEEYQLNYDFNNDSVYYLRYFDFVMNDVDSVSIFIDSIGVKNINGEEVQIQYCRAAGLDGRPNFEIAKGIGRLDYGFKLPLPNILDVISYGDLRCFETADCNIQFVDFPCDTTYSTTSTIGLSESEVDFHPNPTQDKLYLDTPDLNWQYQIYNLQGQQMKEGVYKDYVNVAALPSGIYFLQLQKENELYQAIKFIKE